MIKFTHDMGLRILLSILDSFWKTIFGGSIFGVPSVALSAQTMGQQVPDLTGRYFSIFLTHDMGINDQIYKWVWTDTMGINDQIYTWHGTQDIIVDFGFILENNFWRFHFWGAICGPVRPDNGTAGPWPNGQVFFNFLTHDMGINDQIYTWDGTQGIIVGFGFILFFFGGFHFWGAICNFTAQDGTWKKNGARKKIYYLGVYWGRWRLKNGDLVSEKNTGTSVLLSGRILGKIAPKEWAFGFRKNCQAFLSYNLGVYWGRWRPKNGHLVSGQFSGTCCPTVWADKATNGTPKMDVLWQDIFQGLLSHSLDTHGSKNGFPKRDWPNGRSNWALFWEQKT